MSYTLTIEAPEKVAFFEEERASMTPAEMGELFCLFLSEWRARRQAARVPVVKLDRYQGISPRVQALRGVISLPKDFDERTFKSERFAGKFGE